MVNAVELELDGSDQPNVFRECRRKCGRCYSIARRSHLVRLSVLAIFVAVNACIYAFSNYPGVTRCPRDLGGMSSYNTASYQAIPPLGVNSEQSRVYADIFQRGFDGGYQAGHDAGFYLGANRVHSVVVAMFNAGANPVDIIQHLINAGNPNVAQNTPYAQNTSYVGTQGPPAVNTNRGGVVPQGRLQDQDFQSISLLGEPWYGFVQSMPGTKVLGESLLGAGPPTISDKALKGRVFVNPLPEISSRNNNCNRNKDDFKNSPMQFEDRASAPHRGHVVDHYFRSHGAKEFLGTFYPGMGLPLIMPDKTNWFFPTTVVECHLFWSYNKNRLSGCNGPVCAWKCYALAASAKNRTQRHVQGKNLRVYSFDEEVFAGGQTLICIGQKCNTLPLQRLAENDENVLELTHPFFGLMRLPSRVVCAWCGITKLFICGNRAFKHHADVKGNPVPPTKRVLVDIVKKGGEFVAKPVNDSSIYGPEDQYGYVHKHAGSGMRICIFEQCNLWPSHSGIGPLLVKRMYESYADRPWKLRVRAASTV